MPERQPAITRIPPATHLAVTAAAIAYAGLAHRRMARMRADLAAVFRHGLDCRVDLSRQQLAGASMEAER